MDLHNLICKGAWTPMTEHQQPYQITNCAFDGRCQSTWEELSQTSTLGVRYCSQCQNNIHLCETLEELLWHAKLENAVAWSRQARHLESLNKH